MECNITIPAALIDIRLFDNGLLESLTSPWRDKFSTKGTKEKLVQGLTTDQEQFKVNYPLPIPRTVWMDPYPEMDLHDVLMIITRAFAFGWVDATGASTISNWKWKATGYKNFFGPPGEDVVPFAELARKSKQDARTPARAPVTTGKVSVLNGTILIYTYIALNNSNSTLFKVDISS